MSVINSDWNVLPCSTILQSISKCEFPIFILKTLYLATFQIIKLISVIHITSYEKINELSACIQSSHKVW